METLSGLLTFAGVLAFWVAFISLFRPIKRLGLSTRKRSTVALLLSFVVMGAAGALAPDEPIQAIEPAVQASAAQPEEAPAPPEAVTPRTEQDRAAVLDEVQVLDASIVGNGNMGCRELDHFEELRRVFAVHGESEAFNEALADRVISGACVMFEAGDPVFITGADVTLGLWRVRRKGRTAEYWTYLQAVAR